MSPRAPGRLFHSSFWFAYGLLSVAFGEHNLQGSLHLNRSRALVQMGQQQEAAQDCLYNTVVDLDRFVGSFVWPLVLRVNTKVIKVIGYRNYM